MSKKIRKKKQKEGTNWKVVAGIVAVSAIVLIAMMALAFRDPNTLDLAKYCDNNPENCISRGSNDATARVVEVSDYGCSHCRTFNLETAPLIEEMYVGNEDFQYRVMPFALGAQTVPSAVAAMCANEQGGFWDYHQALFTIQETPAFNTESGFMETAASVGLDSGEFASCLADNDYENIISENMRAVGLAGINSTPSFMINGEVLRGAQPFSVFQMRIDELLN